jgi:hypothetical protein
LTTIPPAGRILNCDLCGEFGIRAVDGRDQYTEFKLPFGSDFYDALGRFVVAFSMAECGADFLAHAIFHHAGGNSIFSKLPKALTLKISFLRTATERLEALQFRAAEILEVLTIFEGLADRRIFYIHGLYATDPAAPNTFEKNKFDGTRLLITELEANVSSIQEDQNAAMAAGMFFLIVSHQLSCR